MNPTTVNLILNFLGVILGGGALGVVLAFINKRQQLRNEDEADIRDHYATEVMALREANIKLEEHFRKMIADIEERHENDRSLWERRWRQSEEDHEQCRKERSAFREEIDGLKQQLKMYSADHVIVLERENDTRPPSERAPAAAKSAERVKKIVEENGK